MKKLINFFKKLFGCKQVCPKCKKDPCECEIEVPTEHKIELDESKVTHNFDVKKTICVTGFTTMSTNVADHNLKDNNDTCCESVPDSKWECTSTATIAAAELNQNDCCKAEPALTKKKRVRKKKVTPVVVDQRIPVEEPEIPVVKVPKPVEVPAEKSAEPKKKCSRKKKTESK